MNLQTDTVGCESPGLGSWFEYESRFDHYREFTTALNAEMYLDCVKLKASRDCLVGVRLGVSNLKVHKVRYH